MVVEIEIITTNENSSISNNENHEANVVDKEILAQIDMELVNQVRRILKEEYRNEFENLEDCKYSQVHYEEIMDESCPVTCWRYLIHCNKSIEESLASIKTALTWRKENKIDESINKIDMELPKELYHLSPFAFTGIDNLNNEVLYAIGKNYRKPDSTLKGIITKFVIQSLFKWDHDNRQNLNQLCLVFDTTSTGIRNIDLDLMTHLVAMRDFIPARLNRVFVIGIPFLVRPVIRLIISWLPEKFRRIVHCGTWEDLILPNISIENLPCEVGGCSDLSRRLAPPNSPWIEDSPVFANDKALKKVIEDAFGFNVPTELREKLRELQIEREEKVTKKIN